MVKISCGGFRDDGFAVIPEVIPPYYCEAIVGCIQNSERAATGARTLLSERWCRALAASVRHNPALARIVPAESVAVQHTLFEKSPDRNWLVSIHQDLSIPVHSNRALLVMLTLNLWFPVTHGPGDAVRSCLSDRAAWVSDVAIGGGVPGGYQLRGNRLRLPWSRSRSTQVT